MKSISDSDASSPSTANSENPYAQDMDALVAGRLAEIFCSPASDTQGPFLAVISL